MLHHVLQAVEKVNASIEIINLHTIKPIDIETIVSTAAKTKKVMTVEDHQTYGGLGSAVAEILVENNPVPMKLLGLINTFTKSARNIEDLYRKYNLDSDSIAKEIKEFIK